MDMTSPVTSSRRRWSSLQLLRQISLTDSIRSFGPAGCFSPCLLALCSSSHTPYALVFSSTSAVVVLTRGSRPSIQSSPLDGFLPQSMATITSCFNLLSSGSVFLLRSCSHSSRGTSTLRGLSASTRTTWISSIGTTNSSRTWTLFMEPIYTANMWRTAFWTPRPLVANRLCLRLLLPGARRCRAARSICPLASVRSHVDTVLRKRKMALPCAACRAISLARSHLQRRARAADPPCYVPFVIHFVGSSPLETHEEGGMTLTS